MTSRSVIQYEKEADLKEALMESPTIDPETGKLAPKDWELGNFDQETSVGDPNEIALEAARLAVLKSYNVIESSKNAEIEDLTTMATEMFNVPIAVVSLIDLGRQWFKSIQGLEAAETPRCLAFCAHVVKRKAEHGVMVVKDATKDDRFKDNAFVTGEAGVRFYAGAQLKSPEGAVLGSFCIIDMKAHPEGLSEDEQRQLKNLADCAIYSMIIESASAGTTPVTPVQEVTIAV